MSTEYERALAAADYIRAAVVKAGLTLPTAALVLGSGLGFLAEEIVDGIRLPYGDIPHFPVSSVTGHAGVLTVGTLSGREVFAFSGRTHYYEGHDLRTVTFYVRVLHLLGVRTLLLTNAAGGVNEQFAAGDLMLITDHIKLCADSPVRGESDERFTPRFFDMSRTYSPRLCDAAREVATRLGLSLREGTYFFMGGPQYETPAEIRAIGALGGDAVSMSTVPEAIVAAGCGMEVMGLSCITNMAAGVLPDTTLSHAEVTATAAKAAATFGRLVRELIPLL